MMIRDEEVSRLKGNPYTQDSAPGSLVRFNARCAGNAGDVLAKAKNVLLIILGENTANWPSNEKWRNLLPEWFVQQSSNEVSHADAVHRLGYSLDERSKMTQQWSVGAFVFWFRPSERHWFWWDARIEKPDLLTIEVVAPDVPFPWASLDWLFRASGALNVDEV